MLSFEDARAKVIEVVTACACPPQIEAVDLAREPAVALGRILAEDIVADRNYPPFDRSIRDGYALRAADAAAPGARLRLIGESRAGVAFNGKVCAGECVRIMTGAPVPKGANAVVMLEVTRADGDEIVLEQAVRPSQYLVLTGAEARVGEIVVKRGTRLGYAELAMAAEVGHADLHLSRRPRVAILSTGDELVELGETPGPYQIRNSNNVSLASQVMLARGEPILAGHAVDLAAELRAAIERAMEADIVLLSGGVSAGKYDLVEQVLHDMGAEVFFDAVAIRPGRPAVFASYEGKPVFGLPGNPVSTMVTFELFVRPAIEVLSGLEPPALPLFKAVLAHPVKEKGAVAHFLPARVTWQSGEPVVETLLWEGSGDIGAVVRSNCFLLVRDSKLQLEAREWVDVLARRGAV